MMTFLMSVFQHVDAAYERRFAGATFADDAENLAIIDGQRNTFQGLDFRLAAVGLRNVFKGNHKINSL